MAHSRRPRWTSSARPSPGERRLPPAHWVGCRDARGANPLKRAACLVALAAAGGLVPAAAADARAPKIDVRPAGLNGTSFSLGQRDYVSRCVPGKTRLKVSAPRGWLAAIGGGELEPGTQARKIAARPGKRVTVRLARRGSDRRRSYDVRCLPRDFPEYTFDRRKPGGPRWFSMQLGFHYAAIFDRAGVPVWWYKAGGEPDNAQVLPDGTFAFDPVDEISFQTGDYEIRTLGGRLIRVVRAGQGATADIHEIQLLKNGNYLLGAQDVYTADTTAYGGSADSPVIGAVIQEVTPEGKVVWEWESQDHIGLEETGRWWLSPAVQADDGYDVVHWNSAIVKGNFVYLSFRHLDAVYKVDRRTGRIVWKLGGTPTPESLDAVADPHGDYPLGGQHDIRPLPDGTVSIHDNRTGLAGEMPRVVRYRVDQKAGTAKLVEQIEDPEVTNSFCCGSARLLDSKDWLVGWGGVGLVAGYGPDGRRLFDLKLEQGFSYRAIPVPPGAIDRGGLRSGMDRIAQRKDAG